MSNILTEKPENRKSIEKENSKKTKRQALSFEAFYQLFKMLSVIYQFIVVQTASSMKRKKLDRIMRAEAFKLVIQKKNEFGYKNLYRALKKRLNGSVNENTYSAFLKRGSINSDLFSTTCEILGISEDDYCNMDTCSKAQADIRWIYDSLYNEDRIAITELVQLLLVSEMDQDYLDWELSQ